MATNPGYARPQSKDILTDEGALAKARAFYPMMIVPGIVLLLAPATVSSIMKYFDFRESLGGLLQVSYFAGGVVGILLITRLMQRFTIRKMVAYSVLLLSVSLLASAVSPWYPLLLAFFVISGFANGILIAFPGVYITRVGGSKSHHAQNLLYSFFSLGVVTGPLLASVIIRGQAPLWRWAFVVPAVLLIPLSLPALLTSFEPIKEVRRLSADTVGRVLTFNSRLFWGLLMAVLLYIAAESAVSMWLVRFLEKEYEVGFSSAHWVLTGLWAGITAGRWFFGVFLRKVDPYRVLIFLSVASALLLLVAPVSGSKTAAIVLYPLVGLFFSAIYPCLIGYIAWFPSELNPSVFTLFLAAGAAGGAFLPYLVGLVNQFVGMAAGMSLISVPLIGVVTCLFWLRGYIRRRPDPSQALSGNTGDGGAPAGEIPPS